MVLDSADFANGLASPLPFNYTMIFLSPPDEGELLQNREWLELVLTHELFHIVHLDMARAAPLGLRRVFGRLPFLFPNLLQPRWIMEGLAVQAESDAAKGYGRLGQTQFEGMMRAEASRGLRSLAEINAGGRGFPLNRDYLYGSYFFAFLQERYGQKALTAFIENYSDNVIPFRVHSNPVVATGKNMDQLWAEYHDWLNARFEKRPVQVREGEVLAREWSLTSPALAADGTRWYVSGDGYTLPKLMRQAPGGKPRGAARCRAGRAPRGFPGRQPPPCPTRDLPELQLLLRPQPRRRRRRFEASHRMRPLPARCAAGRWPYRGACRWKAASPRWSLFGGGVLYRAVAGESVTGIAAKGDSVVVTTLRDGHWSIDSNSARKSGNAAFRSSDQAFAPHR